MKDLLALSVPGFKNIAVPSGVPTGGLAEGNTIFGTGIQLAFVIAVMIAFFMLVWSGIQWTMSGGEKEKIAAARKRIIYSIVGLFVIVLSVFFVNLLLFFFGEQRLGQSNAGRQRELQIQACEAKGKIGQLGHRGEVTCVTKPTVTPVPPACSQFKTPTECERNGCLFSGSCKPYPDTRR